jgi:D-3-phosphoglycerate dehydrogenase
MSGIKKGKGIKIYIPRIKDIHKSAIYLVEKAGCKIVKGKIPSNTQGIDALLVRTYTSVDKNYLEKFPNLKYVLRAGVGMDNIDLEECDRRNIQVFNSPLSNSQSVAEFTVALIILLLRNFPSQAKRARNGKWRSKATIGKELCEVTIGLIGCGAIGQKVAKMLLNMGCEEVLGYDPFLSRQALKKIGIKKVQLHSLLKRSDLASLHLPLNRKTKNLIGHNELKLLGSRSYLVNTSRGGVVNEDGLITALRKNVIAGAALDVFQEEPKIKQAFFELENVIITPHIAALTKNADERMSRIVVENFLQQLN